MRILISNDDGIYSPGIHALATAAQNFGKVRVVAPDVEQSSMGHAITHSRPLTYRKTPLNGIDAYRVNGTPADCVALGAYNWQEGADVVLSGINLGPNLGNSMWHSGTLAAAKQAALLGIRGIALSTVVGDVQADFEQLAPWVDKVLGMLLPEDEFTLLNVNFPPNPKGIAWTCQAVTHYDGAVVPGIDPMGREHFWITVRPLEEFAENSDVWAVENGLISITPLILDLTAHSELEKRMVSSEQATG
jgi:5'-nucleotidase